MKLRELAPALTIAAGLTVAGCSECPKPEQAEPVVVTVDATTTTPVEGTTVPEKISGPYANTDTCASLGRLTSTLHYLDTPDALGPPKTKGDTPSTDLDAVITDLRDTFAAEFPTVDVNGSELDLMADVSASVATSEMLAEAGVVNSPDLLQQATETAQQAVSNNCYTY